MSSDHYLYIVTVAYLYQGEKNNVSSLIQIKVKNVETNKIAVETIFNVNL